MRDGRLPERFAKGVGCELRAAVGDEVLWWSEHLCRRSKEFGDFESGRLLRENANREREPGEDVEDDGELEGKEPEREAISVMSAMVTWLGYRAWTEGAGGRRRTVPRTGIGFSLRILRTVSVAILQPARARLWAMRSLPSKPEAAMVWTRCRTTSAKRRTGGWGLRREPIASLSGWTLLSASQRAIVFEATSKQPAVSC